ncbi:MAG: response regulator [Hyphomicrobiaceae bacterium]
MTANQDIHILVVDDEAPIRTLLRNRLEREGFKVSEARNGFELRQHLSSGPVTLITLDLALGRDDGLALAREIRAERNIPIIMISGKGDEVDRIVGLELGADDYITKPFSPREVVARVRAVLRRYEQAPQPGHEQARELPGGQNLEFEGGTLDLARRSFTTASGEAVDLTTAEFNLFEVFLRRPQRVLSRDEIMNLLKGHDWTPFDRSVDSLIVRLRKKIEPDAERPRYIKTVRGVGYVLACEVSRS